MQTRTEYPAGVPCFVDTGRKNADPAIAFYGGLFGWDAQNVSPEGAPRYHMATLHGHTVAGIGEQDFQTWDPVWNQYVQVEDADATAKEVEQAGGEVKMDPFAIGSAGRMAVFADPHGAEICVWEPGETKGLGLVNDPGAWVASTLVSPDVDEAARFYRTVFGWEVKPIGDAQMFVMPGYVDHLEEINPGTKQQMEDYGAPDGFGDMVAYLIPANERGTRGWGITFSVEDADAAAAKTKQLGGEVVVEPYDAPWVRQAVIKDPEGAELTLSQFVPPEG